LGVKSLEVSMVRWHMGEGKQGPLADTPLPTVAPSIPEDVVDGVLSALSGQVQAVFLPWIADRFSVEWLDVNDDRLGMTRFEAGSNELIRRRTLRLDPGPVTIGLHPALLEDEALYRHTFAHELFHAAGLMLHSELHDRLTNEVAPSPAMKDSPLLQKMRDAVLDTLKVQQWTCKVCGYSWKRTTVRRPTRCLKCARPW
jgi:predicted Zn-ribbon and HTH transcriptional regulator